MEKWRSILILLLIAARLLSAKSGDVTELQINVEYKPASCEVKTQNGDTIKIHYRVRRFNPILVFSNFHFCCLSLVVIFVMLFCHRFPQTC
ncbi:FK506-binding protein 2-like [Lactuca sativa]|uniref:FK506-binding protein 2-like n=1 Tax=Lactuca sativa TaxID=4236 RepID=UPI0022AF0272|nr:FK506-binding protein 2-like [Lactuca sativa]